MTSMSTHIEPGGTAAASEWSTASHELVVDALRGALRVGRDGNSRRTTRDALRKLGAAARENGLRAEHVLIMVKKAWREMPEVHRLPRSDAEDALERVITLCIEEFFASQRKE